MNPFEKCIIYVFFLGLGEMIVALRISEESKAKLKGNDSLNELKDTKLKVDKELADIRTKLSEKEKELQESRVAAAEGIVLPNFPF